MIETVELVCKKLHMPYPNVRIPANMRIAIGPPEIADALVRRGFFERIPPEILAQEVKPTDQEKAGKKRGK